MRQVEKEINGTAYTVGTIGSYEAMDVAVDLIQLIAPAFESVDKASLAKLMERPAEDLLPALASIAMQADKAKIRNITKALAKQTVIHGKDGQPQQLSKVFDVHFSGDFASLVQWLGFAIGVNFLGFSEDSTGEGDALAEWIKTRTAAA